MDNAERYGDVVINAELENGKTGVALQCSSCNARIMRATKQKPDRPLVRMWVMNSGWSIDDDMKNPVCPTCSSMSTRKPNEALDAIKPGRSYPFSYSFVFRQVCQKRATHPLAGHSFGIYLYAPVNFDGRVFVAAESERGILRLFFSKDDPGDAVRVNVTGNHKDRGFVTIGIPRFGWIPEKTFRRHEGVGSFSQLDDGRYAAEITDIPEEVFRWPIKRKTNRVSYELERHWGLTDSTNLPAVAAPPPREDDAPKEPPAPTDPVQILREAVDRVNAVTAVLNDAGAQVSFNADEGKLTATLTYKV
jgi:hypothetical protein